MNITITTPTLKTPHGGTRILNEWAIRLSKWHNVTLFVQDGVLDCSWYEIPPSVILSNSVYAIKSTDCLIIGSPHSVHLQDLIKPTQKCFIYMQMLEHMFAPRNPKFQVQCKKFYLSPHTMFYGSDWNIEFLLKRLGRKGKNIKVGNTTNTDHFPIEVRPKENIILVEGWEATNPAKDVDKVGPRVAESLKHKGYTILAYSQKSLQTLPHVPDEYYRQPTLEQMNDLYNRAKILIKATKYDNRSTAPLEAMVKGTPTIRGIIQGDDDLIDGYNCLRGPYDYDSVYRMANQLLIDSELYDTIQSNCISYVKEFTWDYWMEIVNNEICSND